MDVKLTGLLVLITGSLWIIKIPVRVLFKLDIAKFTKNKNESWLV